ncbi:hypothetical protein BRD15_08365 [Halobacteriales archaeon SW_6_65_15]|nr:MAG: hypothetical protein BRD15_08365 [Halobacteriales archaeon SW_6_65_15]
MGSEPSTAEEVTETHEEIQELKLGIFREWLKVIYIVSTFVSINVVPALFFATVVALEAVVTNVPTVTLQPLAIHATSGEGVSVTKLIKSFVVLDIIRNLIQLYWKGQPSIRFETEAQEINDD